MTVYRSIITGKYFSDGVMATLEGVYGDKFDASMLKPVENPNIIDLLLADEFVVAVKLYRERNQCTLMEAHKMVTIMREDVRRARFDKEYKLC